MKKIFRLAGAEFNKIFYRPSIFILTALLILTLVLSFTMYKPTQNNTQLSYTANTVGGIYTEFTGTKNTINKSSIDSVFLNSKNKVEQDYISITQAQKLETLSNYVSSLNVYLNETLLDEQTKIYGPSTSDDLTLTQKSDLIDVFNTLKQKASNLLNYLAQDIKGNTLDFYLKVSEYDTMYKEIQKLYDNCPTDFSAYKTKANFSYLSNLLRSDYNLPQSRVIIGGLEKITIDSQVYNQLINQYYNDAVQTLNTKYFSDIETFYTANYDSKEESDINEINQLIAKYNSYAKMNSSVLENKFLLLRINDKTDTELTDLIGYTQVSKYQLNEQNLINDYLLDTEQFNYQFLTSFNYNSSSGSSTNAYDYTVYTMQILNVLIIIFTIFYACSTIAGDQSSGTMKMIAIRPYTRNKLFAGKYLSCVMFGVMLMLISSIASFVVGSIVYGLPMTNCLAVFNSSTIITINPILLLLIYLLSNVVNMLFYISLAMFMCLIFKSNTLSVFLTTIIYAIQIVVSGLVFNPILKYTVFGHFDLFKYFGNSQLGLFKFSILPDLDFTTSALVLGLFIVVFNSLSHLIFKKRDIT